MTNAVTLCLATLSTIKHHHTAVLFGDSHHDQIPVGRGGKNDTYIRKPCLSHLLTLTIQTSANSLVLAMHRKVWEAMIEDMNTTWQNNFI